MGVGGFEVGRGGVGWGMGEVEMGRGGVGWGGVGGWVGEVKMGLLG